jgi:hypothetical protein
MVLSGTTLSFSTSEYTFSITLLLLPRYLLRKGAETQKLIYSSGHGTQQADRDGDEGDDGDEAICPLDYERAGLIIDDDSESKILWRP